jgi:choline dehydrogenase
VLKGTLYPRTGTLGGCTAHKALIALYPYRSDFEYIARLMGDMSWSPAEMRKHFVRMEDNSHILLPIKPGHGYDGWLDTEVAPISIPLKDTQLLSLFLGGAFGLGNLTNNIFNLVTLVAGDANEDSEKRDKSPGYYQTPISAEGGVRVGPRDFIVSVRDAKNRDGSKKYPLDVRMNCHVTKVTFDESGDCLPVLGEPTV